MSHNLQTLRVFIASPSDLNDERNAISEVADSLNATFGPEANLHIQILRWEDTLPSVGRPQALINEDLDKADLFIGILSRKWGSSPGGEKYSSGFEEEFFRALARNEKTGIPQMSMFFKEVEPATQSDPGEDLKKILDFKTSLIASKKILFGDFKDIQDWKTKTRNHLERHLLRLLNPKTSSTLQTQPQQPAEHQVIDTARIPEGQSKVPEAARQQVALLFNETADAIQQGNLSTYGKSSENLNAFKVARLGLAVSSILNRDIESGLLGTHLINLLFKNRKEVALNKIEELLVLRNNLATPYDSAPGWYWLQKFSINLNQLLPFLAYHDQDAQVRLAAIHLATELDLSLLPQPKTPQNSIKRICSHEDAMTRKAGLEYLAVKGRITDLSFAEMLVNDPENIVRAQADQTIRDIRLRHNPTTYFVNSVLGGSYVNDDIITAVVPYANKLSTDIIRYALGHSLEKIRSFAAQTLADRGLIAPGEINQLKINEPAEIWQAYYTERINSGIHCDPGEIRKNLTIPFLGFSLISLRKVDPNKIILKMFRQYSYEELLRHLEFLAPDGEIAYRVLAEEHFEKFGDKLRSDIEDNFESFERASKISAPARLIGILDHLTDAAGSSKLRLLALALSGLSSHAKKADREVFLRFIKHESQEVRLAAMGGLRQAGNTEDSVLLLHAAEDATGEEAIVAASVAITLFPGEGGPAFELLKSRKPELFKLAIRTLMSSTRSHLWNQIKGRLYDEDENIRKAVSAYAVLKFRPKELTKILEVYLSKDIYYYNVVFYFDRALYAKLPLRKLFLKEIKGFLE